MREVEVKFFPACKGLREGLEHVVLIEPGELILVNTSNGKGKDTTLGIFECLMGDWLIYAQQPHHPSETILPGGHVLAYFRPRIPKRLPSTEHNHGNSVLYINNIITGKESILEYLRTHHALHVPLVQAMQKPYASPEARARMGI